MKSPAFRFYADDFIAGTYHMSQAEVGAYIRLLCVQWNRGSIPVEPELNQKLAGGPVSDEVMSKFVPSPKGGLVNLRLEHEREKQKSFSASQRAKGIKSGIVRKSTTEPGFNRGSTGVQPNTNPPYPSPLPLPLPSPLPNPEPSTPTSHLNSTLVVTPEKRGRKPRTTDEEFLQSLRADKTYQGTDVDREHGKATRWCEVHGRVLTRRFFVNWLNRSADRMNGNHGPTPPPQNANMGGLEEWRAEFAAECAKGDDVPFQ